MSFVKQKHHQQKISGRGSVSSQVERALAFQQAGRLQEAKKYYRKILKHNPHNIDALHLMGVLASQLGKEDVAFDYISKAIQIAPRFPEALNNRGLINEKLSRDDAAVCDYNDAIKMKPTFVDALYNRGCLFLKKAMFERARDDFNRVISLEPCHLKATTNRGLAFKGLKDYSPALADFTQVISMSPGSHQAYNNRGNVFSKIGKKDQALSDFNEAISLAPDFAKAYNNKGALLLELKKFHDALESFEKALDLNPNFTKALNNRGLTFLALNCFENAAADFLAAIGLQPDFLGALNNLGVLYDELKMPQKALKAFDEAISINPKYADAQFNKSILLLRLGNYDMGWSLYEWRKHPEKQREFTSTLRRFAEPLWLGKEDISGKTVFLYWEQGLGDTIQFSRLAEQVSLLGGKVLLEVQEPLANLMQGLRGVHQIIRPGDKIPEFDFHCPLMSLPHALGLTIDCVPANVPYVGVSKDMLEFWRNKLGEQIQPRVGIVWSGNKLHNNDHNRSIRLAELAGNISAVSQLFSLQKEMPSEDLEYFSNCENIQHFGDDLLSFSETAALTQLMDIVISVDTSVAHLAGALGKNVQLLLPYTADFRWLEDTDKSPWYPSMTILRQGAGRSWADVMRSVNSAIDDCKLPKFHKGPPARLPGN